MILTILLTIWITCGVIYVSKNLASPFYSTMCIVLDFIFSPYFIYSDIRHEWNEWREIRNKYK